MHSAIYSKMAYNYMKEKTDIVLRDQDESVL